MSNSWEQNLGHFQLKVKCTFFNNECLEQLTEGCGGFSCCLKLPKHVWLSLRYTKRYGLSAEIDGQNVLPTVVQEVSLDDLNNLYQLSHVPVYKKKKKKGEGHDATS